MEVPQYLRLYQGTPGPAKVFWVGFAKETMSISTLPLNANLTVKQQITFEPGTSDLFFSDLFFSEPPTSRPLFLRALDARDPGSLYPGSPGSPGSLYPGSLYLRAIEVR
jgi:hypothetical protein